MTQIVIVKTVKNEKTKETVSEKEYVAVESVNSLWNKPVFKFKEDGNDVAVLKERLGKVLPSKKAGEYVIYTQK